MIQRTDAAVQALIPIKAAENDKNWQQALAESITDPKQLIQLLQLPVSLLPQLQRASESFQLRVPRPFLELMKPGNLNDPLLLQVLPQTQELLSQPGYLSDPLQEAGHNPQRGIIHKYHGRVLLTLSGACAVNCRYCFRRHFPYQDNQLGSQQWQQALSYLRQHPEVEEVIFSGGDPLATPDNRIFNMIEDLEQLPQLKRLRIHSRLPVVIPQRLTDALSQRLQQSRLQVVLVLHINHPNEISTALHQRLQSLQLGGITLLNQSVLLKGVNDNSDTLVHLSEKLFTSGILPYYLYLLDPVEGAAHFDLSETQAKLLAGQMAARLPGYLVPRLARDIPGKTAKTQILPQVINLE